MRAIGRNFWRFMVIFSFIVNVVLVVVLIVAGLLIFEIKNQIAQPLVEGLHSSFVGLDQATIDWTIPVRDQIPVVLDIPLQQDTVVILQQPVPLQVTATIDLPGINAYGVAANVNLELPVGLELPVYLDIPVHVDQPLDVSLDVRAVIPLSETQLHDVADNLRLQLEPLAIALNNLPGGFDEVPGFVGDVFAGDVNLLEANDYSRQPWGGYSMTAGYGYTLYTEEVPQNNLPLDTGIVPVGGMPFLDEQIRPLIYADGGPADVNAQAEANLAAQGIDPIYWRDGLGPLMRSNIPAPSDLSGSAQTVPIVPSTGVQDAGIITPPTQDAPPTGESPTEAPNLPTATPNPDQGIIVTPGG